MKLLEVFRYELEYGFRNRSTWVYAVLLLGFAFASASDVPPVSALHANAPLTLARDALLTGMIGLLVSASLFGEAALRDVESGMDALLFSSPQRTIDHLLGRYLAAAATNALLLLAVPVGCALPALVGYPDPAHFGPFRLGAVLEPWLILLLPNMALTGAVLFAVAVLSRRLTAVYISGFAMFMGALLLAELFGSRIDPSGIGILSALRGGTDDALNEGVRQWTAEGQNTRRISSSPALLVNRAVWLAVTAGVLVALHKLFTFTYRTGGGARRDRSEEAVAARALSLRGKRVNTSFGVGTAVRQSLAIARNSFAEVALNPWFAGVMVVLAIWCGALVEKAAALPFDTPTWPVTMAVVGALSRDFIVGVYVLLVFYAGELVWKNRDVRVADIADAAPVADGPVVLGRTLALVGIAVAFLVSAMVGSMLGQLAHDHSDVEPWLYVRALFGLNLANIVLIAVLVTTVHVVVNHKYLGIVAALFALILPFTGRLLGHNLLVFAGDPGWTYSDMNGFGPFLAPFFWFKLYWAGWALFLVVVTSLLWVRGRETGVPSRLRQARSRLGRALRVTVVSAIALIITVGSFIFYNTNVLNAFDTRAGQSASVAENDSRYRQLENVPQPVVERAELRAEIHPERAAVDLSGAFVLVNRHERAIDTLHVSTHSRLTTRSITFDREASLIGTHTTSRFRSYALARALAPGDSVRMLFDLGFRQRGFPNSGIQTDVVENGTAFGREWLPFVGHPRLGGEVKVETTIGTAADQIAVTSGVLRREWMENGRRYFQYVVDTPQRFEAPVFSARYAIRTDQWVTPTADSARGVALAVYHHPAHDRNIDTIVRSMKASLAYYAEHFGPYPGSMLRVVEVPRYAALAPSVDDVVAFTEGTFISRTMPGQTDMLFFDTASEVAQRWWGEGAHRTTGGNDFAAGTLADYFAMMVTETAHGADAARRVYASRMDSYVSARPRAGHEVPLVAAQRQPYLVHGKGPLAMYLIRDYIGAAAVNTALRQFADKRRAGTLTSATPRHLVAELRAVTPDSLQYLVTDLFETVTTWDIRADRAVVEHTVSGEYRVTLDVVAKKLRADSAGAHTEVPMDDFIDIGVFPQVAGTALGEPLYLARHRIRSGKQTITIILRGRPARAGIDPYRKLIDLAGRDNVVDVVTTSAGRRD